MRTVVTVLLVVFVVYASPEEDMSRVIDALYRADGETILNYLSVENQEALATVISMVRLVPGQISEQLREQLDVQLSPGEVASLTGEELISVIVDSPFFRGEIPPSRDMISCNSHTMHGDTAYAFISIVNEDSVYSYPMVLQDGFWKITRSFF